MLSLIPRHIIFAYALRLLYPVKLGHFIDGGCIKKRSIPPTILLNVLIGLFRDYNVIQYIFIDFVISPYFILFEVCLAP